MDDSEKEKLLARARRLEEKMLFVKAAEIYASLSMEADAAAAYEKGSDYTRAASLFEKLGKADDAARCRKRRDEGATGGTWQDLQAEFQQDKGNPY
ncbi:MAG: hypothetical protein WC717_04005 [Candidatus Micrarchaeia archaeon]|jgi:hypothetical protein